MAYVVLARKFRPQTLGEVIGQDAVVRTLTNAITQRRIHHAYLFTGARGVGKTSIARILAKSLNCEQGPTPAPCGACAACVEITKSSSPDVLEIDGASNTSVDDVRDLRETVKYLPARGKYKIYIIDEVHMLSQSAFNALLKTLEEPPEHVIFVFATTEPHKIPITILSRCQRFDFRRVPPTILASRLAFVANAEGVQIDSAAIQIVAKAADGSVRDAMSLLDQVIAFCGNEIDASAAQQALGLLDREKVRALLAALLGRDRPRVSALVQEAFISGADLAEIAERLVEAVRDLALAKITQGRADSLSGFMPEELEGLLAQARDISEPDLHRLFATLVKTAEDTAKSAFAHLSFEMGLLRACDLEPVTALAELVNELRTGERGGGNDRGAPGGGTVGGSGTAASSGSTTAGGGSAGGEPSSRTAPVERAQAVPPGFRELSAMLKAHKPRLGSACENVVCSLYAPPRVVVSVPNGNEVFGEILREKDTSLELAALFGDRLQLVIEAAPAESSATLAEERRHERQAEVRELKQAGSAHPAVKKVIETLGGEIRGVQVRAALSHPAEDYE